MVNNSSERKRRHPLNVAYPTELIIKMLKRMSVVEDDAPVVSSVVKMNTSTAFLEPFDYLIQGFGINHRGQFDAGLLLLGKESQAGAYLEA